MIGPAGTPCRRRLERLQHPAHRAPAAWRRWTWASCRAQAGRDVAGIVDGAQKGEIDFIYLLGADEFDVSAHLGRRFCRSIRAAMAMPAPIMPM